MPHRLFTIAAIGGLLLLFAVAVDTAAQPPEKPGAAATDNKRIELPAVLRLLRDEKPAEVRRGADRLRESPPTDREELLAAADAVKSALSMTRDATVEAALRLALGKLAAAGVEDAAEWGFESMSVTHRPNTPPKVFESHVQALEMVPGAAKELMLGNLDVALNMEDVDPKERQRLKEFVTLTAEAMRTRELAVFLDALLTGEEDMFVKIEAPLEVRLIASYQNVKAEPPIKADAVAAWLDMHPGGPVEVEIAALETISLVGTTKADAASTLADRLLAKLDNAVVIAKRLVQGRFHKSLSPQVRAALEQHLKRQPTDEVRQALQDLARFEKR